MFGVGMGGGMGALSSNWGYLRGLTQKILKFHALRSAFLWILDMVLLEIMVKAKKPSGLIGGSGPPDPPPVSATGIQL